MKAGEIIETAFIAELLDADIIFNQQLAGVTNPYFNQELGIGLAGARFEIPAERIGTDTGHLGYLIQLKPDIAPPAGDAPKQDSADLHAWAEVFLPGAGWIGFDATSGLLTAEGHIPLVAAMHFQSAAPITGTVEQAETKFSFEMSVTRV